MARDEVVDSPLLGTHALLVGWFYRMDGRVSLVILVPHLWIHVFPLVEKFSHIVCIGIAGLKPLDQVWQLHSRWKAVRLRTRVANKTILIQFLSYLHCIC